MESSSAATFDPASVTRPDPALLKYYVLVALMTGLGFPFVILPLYFKYHTLHYRIDDKGIAMSWGILWKREIYLTYRRIQDIHVTRNLFHRWLGLAAVGVQTASGSATPEMTIEGIRNPEQIRDFLYLKMRGAEQHSMDDAQMSEASSKPADEALELLKEIRDLLAARSHRGGAA